MPKKTERKTLDGWMYLHNEMRRVELVHDTSEPRAYQWSLYIDGDLHDGFETLDDVLEECRGVLFEDQVFVARPNANWTFYSPIDLYKFFGKRRPK